MVNLQFYLCSGMLLKLNRFLLTFLLCFIYIYKYIYIHPVLIPSNSGDNLEHCICTYAQLLVLSSGCNLHFRYTVVC